MRSWKAWLVVAGLLVAAAGFVNLLLAASSPHGCENPSDKSYRLRSLIPQSPCQRRGFLFLQYPTKTPHSASNTWHHCHQRSLTTTPSRHSVPHNKNSRHTKASLNIPLLTSILIPSTHSPITSLPIAITDAIGSSKSHRHLMPLIRDLIEATIKCERELLLPW